MKTDPQKTNEKSVPQNIELLFNRASSVIEQARATAYRHINATLVRRNWELGRMIAEEELNGQDRAKYGAAIIKALSKRLTASYGKGFTKRDIYNYLTFYKAYKTLFSTSDGIVHSLSAQFAPLLSWTHYRTLVQELNDAARKWYEKEAADQGWSVRTLQRNISSQYYFRRLASQRKELVEEEMLQLTAPLQSTDPTEFIKNPVIGEFLGFTADASSRQRPSFRFEIYALYTYARAAPRRDRATKGNLLSKAERVRNRLKPICRAL